MAVPFACLFSLRKPKLCVLQVWRSLFDLGGSIEGREEIAEGMRVCPELLKTPDDVAQLADWASSAWDYMVSQYMLHRTRHSDHMIMRRIQLLLTKKASGT